MYSRSMLAGAGTLLAAPILVIAGTLTQPTLSDDAAKKVAAIADHRGPMIAGMTLSMIAVISLIAGTAWLALTLAPRAPRLAMAGGALGYGPGFATGTKALVIISFALLFAGLVSAVRTLVTLSGPQLAAQAAQAAAIS